MKKTSWEVCCWSGPWLRSPFRREIADKSEHAQIATPGGSNVNFSAESIQRQEQVMQLKGNVEIRTHDMAYVRTMSLTSEDR